MNTIQAKISFLHDARPYMDSRDYENITLSFPFGALPNVGDSISLQNIKHPSGGYFIIHRDFSQKANNSFEIELTLGFETDLT